MKQLITLLLMATIQITFMQKVIASVPLLESNKQSMLQGNKQLISHCDMIASDMNLITCVEKAQNCQSDCDMMSVVSVIHFIENEQTLAVLYTLFNYPDFIASPRYFQPTSLYRPPLLS
ncbi:MAG: hypothetical protein V5786_04450 [Psychromonas sp.]